MELRQTIAVTDQTRTASDTATLSDRLGAIVAEALDDMTNHDLARHCDRTGHMFVDLFGIPFPGVDEIRVFTDADTISGTVDAWTIQARVRLDTDCGEFDVAIVFAGRTLPGITRITGIARV